MAEQTRSAPSDPLALLDLPLALLAGALWYVAPSLGPWPLLLVAAGLATRMIARPRVRFGLAGVDAAVALFLLSAILGLAIAYDPLPAQAKFWTITGGVALYGAFCRAPRAALIGGLAVEPIRAVLAMLPAAVALFFLLTANWSQLAGKLELARGVYQVLASLQPQLGLDGLHSNVAAGLIAVFLPLQIVALGKSGWRYAFLPVSALALLLSLSRGAWLALAIVAATWLVWTLASRGRGRVALGGAAGGLLLLAVMLAQPAVAQESEPAQPLVEATNQASALPSQPPANEAALRGDTEGRLSLLRNGAALARDYAFTGLGLGGFPMAYSSYMLLVHVGHTVHSHNLFLNVWLEMGLPGLLALVWLLAAAVIAARRVLRYGEASSRIWAAAALAGAGVLCLHGMVDDAFFGSRGVLVMLLPFATLRREEARAPARRPAMPPAQVDRAGLLAAAGIALALAAALLPQVRSQLQANLGTLYQTRFELAQYDWPEWPIQDELRRAQGYNIEPALARYGAALALDGANETANRRLGQIMISRGEYAAAGFRLATAYGSGYANQAGRQLYGEWLAMEGRPQEAAAVWRTLDLRQGQLEAREWWYEHVGERGKADAIRLAAEMR
jgi:O-antigen ligase